MSSSASVDGKDERALNEVDAWLKDYRALCNAKEDSKIDLAKSKQVLIKLKTSMAQNFQLFPPFTGKPYAVKKQLILAREVYELSALFNIRTRDLESFRRHVNMLKPYYFDYQSLLPDSERKWPILGLHLMDLLSHNQLAEFHTEIETINLKEQTNVLYIKFPIELEQNLMEGSYNKILTAKLRVPLPPFLFFVDILADTVREKISQCSERAYASLPLEDAKTLLRFQTQSELTAYAQKREWTIQNNTVFFSRAAAGSAELSAQDLPTHHLIGLQLQYATELERIV